MLLTFLMMSCVSYAALQANDGIPLMETSIRRFLQNWDEDDELQYILAFYDLNNDGKNEDIVYLTSRKWCGSGGCNTLILEQNDDSWEIISRTTLTRPPIRVLKSISKGWHSLSVWVQGGGIQPGYEAELIFDGKTYPMNPTIPPAQKVVGESTEKELIPEEP